MSCRKLLGVSFRRIDYWRIRKKLLAKSCYEDQTKKTKRSLKMMARIHEEDVNIYDTNAHGHSYNR